MRTYYIFKINNIFRTNFRRKTINIYKVLRNIKNTSDKNKALNIYKRLVIPLNKNKVSNYISKVHINDFYYKKDNNKHVLYTSKETSELIVNNTFIKIETNNNITTFFKDICNIDNNFFLIDFDNNDYFFLEDFKNKITCVYL